MVGGKLGKSIAAKMGTLGKKVALIEKDENMFGGTCINVGCLPTKSLVHSSKLLKQIEKYGLEEVMNTIIFSLKNSKRRKIKWLKG